MNGENYVLYYDCGTTNTRAFLVDENFHLISQARLKVGARNIAILGESATMLNCLYDLMIEIINQTGIDREQIAEIYASGMITSPYGLYEVPHVTLPTSLDEYSRKVYVFYEDQVFHQSIHLVLGMKTEHEDPSFINNVRGEDIETIGVLGVLEDSILEGGIALVFPGSHTHVMYVRNKEIIGICSNFTGELFEALKTDTILSPILTETPNSLDANMVLKGLENLEKFGFNRAIYIAHAMKILNLANMPAIFSYAEGVINGGMLKSIEFYCKKIWQDCKQVGIVGNRFMYDLFSTIFGASNQIENLIWLSTDERNYALQGIFEVIRAKENINGN